MMEEFAEVEALVRNTVFSSVREDDRFIWDLSETADASRNESGDLFLQDLPFFLVETEIVDVSRAGPSTEARRRVRGTLLLSYLTKNFSDKLTALAQLNRVASWFADSTLEGVRFRQYHPAGSGPTMGFMSYDAAIPFDLELTPMKRVI